MKHMIAVGASIVNANYRGPVEVVLFNFSAWRTSSSRRGTASRS